MMKIKKMGRLMFLREIMRVGVSRYFGISQESLIRNSVFPWIPGCCFFQCSVILWYFLLIVIEVTDR